MKCLFVLVAVCFLSIAAATAPLLNMESDSRIPDQYLVVFHRDSTVDIRNKHVDELTQRLTGDEKIIHRFDIGTVIGYSAVLSKATLAGELEHPNVRYIEADQIVTAFDSTTVQNGATWGIARISHKATTGTTYSSFTSGGAGVTAYVIDTGILTTHNEFEGRAIQGTNTVPGEGNTDGNGHGTHVAGTIGGKTYGVAKKVTLVAVKVLSSGGSGSWAGVVEGVDWVAKNHTGRGNNALSVANMSLGGGAQQTLDDAIREVIRLGVHFALAAGNENQNACNVSPARVAEALTVAASTSADARATYSNFGTCVDIIAPGSAITAAYIGAPLNSATASLSGTSMAAPHVAGAVAVRLGHLRNTGQAYPTPAALATWLRSVATPNEISGAGTGTPNYLLYSPFA